MRVEVNGSRTVYARTTNPDGSRERSITVSRGVVNTKLARAVNVWGSRKFAVHYLGYGKWNGWHFWEFTKSGPLPDPQPVTDPTLLLLLEGLSPGAPIEPLCDRIMECYGQTADTIHEILTLDRERNGNEETGR